LQPLIDSSVRSSPNALALSPANFEKLITDETEKWAKVITFMGIKPE